MKLSKILAFAAVAALAVLSSCKEEEKLGAASISLDPTEVTLTAEAGATATVDLVATREWTVTGVPDWLTVTPNSGQGSNKKQLVTLTAKSNPDVERTANLAFSIGFNDAVLKVKQEGEAGTAEEAILYKNDFDKTTFEKPDSGWPYLDKVDYWRNESGNGIAKVKYEFNGMSVRNNGQTSDHSASLYPGSGKNFLFFGKTSTFAVKSIALNGNTSFALSFGGERYSSDDNDNTFNSEEFKVYVSVDGIKGVELVPSFKDNTVPVGTWNLATCKFSVPEGTDSLTVVFKCDKLNTKSTGGVYRIDDLQLALSAGGAAIDLSTAVSLGLDQSANIPDSDDVTNLATIIAKTPGSNVTILNATVTAVNTKAYVISDGTTHLYVYKNADPKLAVGDKVSLIGTFKYYWGEYEIVESSEKKTGTATPVYGNPTEITKDFLTRCKAAAPEAEESTGYNGPWYPIYAHASATVHKDGNYTQFKVEGDDSYLSLVSAPSAMFADASGTSWGEGDEVELLGYYTGWEGKNEYHQFVAVRVTGQATYTPVEAAVAGDDVFIAANVAHDQKVTNGTAFTNPIIVGNASFSFLGGGNNGKYYDAGTAARMYKDGSLKIESSKPIVKVEYLFAPKDNNGTYNPVEADLSKLFTVGSCTFDATKNVLTWTGKAMEVVFTYPLESGNYRFQQIGVTYGEDVEPRLSASPLAISVTADETSAKFNVQSNTSWTIASDKDNFVARPASGQGDSEVIVVFPANESTEAEVVAKLTVSADGCDDVVVTITQDKAVDLSQATDLSTITAITTVDTQVEILGATVTAVTLKSFVVSDGTNHVYVWMNGDPKVAVGDIVNVTGGKIAANYGSLQISGATVTKVGTGEVKYPEPVDITENFATYSNANKHTVFVTLTAKPGKSGNYTNLFVDGLQTPTASFANPPQINGQSFWNNFELGATYKVKAYYTGYNSSSKFHQLVYVSSEKVGEAAPSLKVDKTAVNVAATATSATINVTSNIDWTATVTSGSAELVGGDGTTGSSVTGTGDGRFMVCFAANEDTENAWTYTVTLSGEGVDDVVVTITQKAKVVQAGGSWVRVTSVEQITSGTYIIGYEETAGSGVIVPLRSDAAGAKTSANGILYSGTADDATSNSGTIDMSTIKDTEKYEVGMGPSATVDGAKCIKLSIGLVGAPASKNTARLYTSDCANTAYVITAKENDTFQFYCAAGVVTSGSNAGDYCYLQYNTGSPRFANYTGGQKNPVIYKFVESE